MQSGRPFWSSAGAEAGDERACAANWLGWRAAEVLRRGPARFAPGWGLRSGPVWSFFGTRLAVDPQLADSLVTGADPPKPQLLSVYARAAYLDRDNRCPVSVDLSELFPGVPVGVVDRGTAVLVTRGRSRASAGAVQVTRSMILNPKRARDGVLAQRLSSMPPVDSAMDGPAVYNTCCSRGELLITAPTCRFFRTSACPRSLSREKR